MIITEDNFYIFDRVEEILNKHYNGWNINDDTFNGTLEEETILTMIEDLCDEIEFRSKEQQDDYPDEERDREREVLGL